MSSTHKPLSALVITTLIVGLSACSDAPVTQVYLDRLSNVLKVELSESHADSVAWGDLQLPAEQQRLITPASDLAGTLSIREFMGLKQCRLHHVLAQRNSPMGRLAVASQQLINDVQIIRAIPACIKTIEGSQPKLAKKLRATLQSKRDQLDEAVARALIAGPEYSAFWRLHKNATPIQDSLAADSLDYFISLLQGQTVALGELEQHLDRLRQGGAGQWLSQLMILASAMETANQLVEERLRNPLCLNNTPTTQATYFSNVVDKVYIAQVQSQAVVLERIATSLMPAISTIEEELLEQLSPSYHAWRLARNESISRGRQAAKNHTQRLAKLYKQCGLSVGNRAA